MSTSTCAGTTVYCTRAVPYCTRTTSTVRDSNVPPTKPRQITNPYTVQYSYCPCIVADTSLTTSQCDLARLRQVGQLEGRDLAKSFGAPFIECSAADGVNVEIAFRELVKLVRRDERVRCKCECECECEHGYGFGYGKCSGVLRLRVESLEPLVKPR